MSQIINITEAENAIALLLWKNDKLIYLLNLINIYSEVEGVFNYQNITQVIRFKLYIIFFLFFNFFILVYISSPLFMDNFSNNEINYNLHFSIC